MSIKVPQGFTMTGVACGIKSDLNKEDLTLIYCPEGAVAAGVYTENLMRAPCVDWDRDHTPSNDIRVVVVNSGNANACTGKQGVDDTQSMATLAAEAVGTSPEHVLIMSTGIIGTFLPMLKIETGISQACSHLSNDTDAFLSAARGILTTDKSHKVAGREIIIAGTPIRIAGMCKGAGMIGPSMATMLGTILTDAPLTADDAQRLLVEVVNDSFNCISVEGHTSTNDTVLLLASGKAKQTPLSGQDLTSFQAAVKEVCVELAKQIPADGEGASHLITIDVTGTATRQDAFQIAKTIADSALVKTGIAGADPNWGRIISAVGYAGVDLDPACVGLSLNNIPVYSDGGPVDFDEQLASDSIRKHRETSIQLQVGNGSGTVRFWTSDLTVDYVRFNSEYHT